MPLQRFIPSSSDRYISNDKNQGAVKFGHLNAVVDYINSSVIPDGLQLEGDGPLTSTPRYITDNSGNLSSLAISSGNIGVKTSTPVSNLETRTSDGLGSVRIYNNNDSSAPLHLLRGNGGGVGLNTFSNGGTIDLPTDRTTLGYLTRFTGNVYVDGSFRTAARIEYYLTSVPSAANLNCAIRFMTAKPSNYSIEERAGITSDGNFQIGDSIVNNRNSKLFIKGSGSSSATTSLLVQNSSGAEIFKVTDDGVTTTNTGGQQFTFTGGGGIARIQAPNEMTIGLGASFNAMKVYYDGRIGLQNDALYINGGKVGIGTTNPYKSLDIVGTGLLFRSTLVAASTQFLTSGNSLFVYTNDGSKVSQIFYQSGNVGIGSGSDLAQLSIKGSGSTSATTSLLVQNSAGTQALKVQDDTNVFIGGTNGGGLTIGNAVGGEQYYVKINASLPGTGPRGGLLWSDVNSQIKSVRKYPGGNDSTISIVNAGVELITIQGTTAAGINTNNVGINNTNPDATAILDVASTTKGFLPPRMTTAQKLAIATPAAGLMVYDNSLNQMSYYNGSTWINF